MKRYWSNLMTWGDDWTNEFFLTFYFTSGYASRPNSEILKQFLKTIEGKTGFCGKKQVPIALDVSHH